MPWTILTITHESEKVPISVLWVGDQRRAEFAAAWSSLAAHAVVCPAADSRAAQRLLASQDGSDELTPPDLVVVAQTYPGQNSAADIDSLRQLVPLSPVVALLGSWCEGESRSGQPWAGAERVYWHQWGPRFELELARLAGGQPPQWSLPATTSDEERLLAVAPQSGLGGQGVVAIRARSRDVAQLLADACRRRGYAPIVVSGPPHETRLQGAVAAVWEGDDCLDDAVREITQLCSAIAPAPVVALLSFPRVDDVRLAVAAGAAVVMSKPLRVDELLSQLERLSRRTGLQPVE